MNKPGVQVRSDSIPMSDAEILILEHWTTDLRKDALYLVGEVSGDPCVADGTTYRTSPVKWMRSDIGIAQTQNAVYILRNRR
jgi:hypothetical protein